MLKKILLLLLIVFAVMQFIQIDVSVPTDAESKIDFLAKYNVPEDISKLVKDGCYDCHSYETEYKWYMHIAPISWLTKGHVEDGRKHLNFSDWDAYDLRKKVHKLEECYEEIEGYKMPIPGYITMHPEADFDQADREKLIAWFKEMEQTITN
ncbi:MAG: heme-binding domain-containing protein [Putridiphycobacter sp.]|nr:heme-binding domain-containing protein [Putridiphycobacter sp.]